MKRTMKNVKNYNDFKRKSEPINEIFGFNRRREKERDTNRKEGISNKKEKCEEIAIENEQLPEFIEISELILDGDIKRVFDESSSYVRQYVFVLNDNRIVKIRDGNAGDDWYDIRIAGMEIDDKPLGDAEKYKDLWIYFVGGLITIESFEKFVGIAKRYKYLK